MIELEEKNFQWHKNKGSTGTVTDFDFSDVGSP